MLVTTGANCDMNKALLWRGVSRVDRSGSDGARSTYFDHAPFRLQAVDPGPTDFMVSVCYCAEPLCDDEHPQRYSQQLSNHGSLPGPQGHVGMVVVPEIGSFRWAGAAVVGARVFFAPFPAKKILVVDAVLRTTEFWSFPQNPDVHWRDQTWAGVVAVGSNLFFSPWGAREILHVDAFTCAAVLLPLPWSDWTPPANTGRWRGGVAVGSRAFFAPMDAVEILVVDAPSRAISFLALPSPYKCSAFWGLCKRYAKWSGAVAAGNTIFFIPCDAQHILVLDATSQATTLIPLPEAGGGSTLLQDQKAKWDGGATVGSYAFFTPFYAEEVLVLDMESRRASLLPLPAAGATGPMKVKWSGAAAVGSIVFFCPSTSPDILVIETTSNATAFLPVPPSGPTRFGGKNKWNGAAVVNGTVVCALDYALDVLTIEGLMKFPISGHIHSSPESGTRSAPSSRVA